MTKTRVLDGLKGAIAEQGGRGGENYDELISAPRAYFRYSTFTLMAPSSSTRMGNELSAWPPHPPPVRELMATRKAAMQPVAPAVPSQSLSAQPSRVETVTSQAAAPVTVSRGEYQSAAIDTGIRSFPAIQPVSPTLRPLSTWQWNRSFCPLFLAMHRQCARWQSKRGIFDQPQVVATDLRSGDCRQSLAALSRSCQRYRQALRGTLPFSPRTCRFGRR